MRCRLRLVLLLAAPIGASPVAAAEGGIAAAYPGDVGIGRDPRVLLVEDFERGDVRDLSSRWSDVKNAAGMSFVADVPASSPGKRALEITSKAGVDDGGHLFAALPSGHERVHLRYYVQYASGGTYHHAGGWLGGYHPASRFPQGGAGERPRGDERFTVGFEPVDRDLRLDFYAYWMGMHPDGGGGFWGNHLLANPALRAVPERWSCVEILVKLNEPVESANGELAVWVDGAKAGHLGKGFPTGAWSGGRFTPGPTGSPFEGFQWRRDPALDVDFVWLQLYTTDDPPGHVGRMRLDHVVVATDYIGPIAPR